MNERARLCQEGDAGLSGKRDWEDTLQHNENAEI